MKNYNIQLTFEDIRLLANVCRASADSLGRTPGHEMCGVPILEVSQKILRQARTQAAEWLDEVSRDEQHPH